MSCGDPYKLARNPLMLYGGGESPLSFSYSSNSNSSYRPSDFYASRPSGYQNVGGGISSNFLATLARYESKKKEDDKFGPKGDGDNGGMKNKNETISLSTYKPKNYKKDSINSNSKNDKFNLYDSKNKLLITLNPYTSKYEINQLDHLEDKPMSELEQTLTMEDKIVNSFLDKLNKRDEINSLTDKLVAINTGGIEIERAA